GPLKNKSTITSNNKMFIANNSKNRLVCLGWISKLERKETFSFETRVAPLRTQPKLRPLQTVPNLFPSRAHRSSVSALRAACERPLSEQSKSIESNSKFANSD